MQPDFVRINESIILIWAKTFNMVLTQLSGAPHARVWINQISKSYYELVQVKINVFLNSYASSETVCDALRNLVPCAQF